MEGYKKIIQGLIDLLEKGFIESYYYYVENHNAQYLNYKEDSDYLLKYPKKIQDVDFKDESFMSVFDQNEYETYIKLKEALELIEKGEQNE